MFKISIHLLPNSPSKISKLIKETISISYQHLPKRIKKKITKNHLLSISLVSQTEMKRVNYQFRKKNKPTDVLSFSRLEGMKMPTTEQGPDIGDLIICWPIAKKQARKYRVSIEEEIIRLTAHGFLHLFGYDHEKSSKEAKRMFSLQDKIIAELKNT